MKKYSLIMLLSIAVVISLLMSVTAFAAGTSSEGLVAADSVKSDVDKTKFTHKEWTGTDYTDVDGNSVTGEDVFGINREDATVPRIDYPSVDSAAAAVWDYNAREDSVYFKLLTGKDETWDLTVFQNETLMQHLMGTDGFMTAEFVKDAADGWKEVTLPASWPSQGFDYSHYSGSTPWETKYDSSMTAPLAPTNYSPVGLYRKTFTVSEEMRADNRRVYISLEGVEAAYYLYINGKEVGYSEDSFSPHRFDITDYLSGGENLLALKVHKLIDGTWFETQDMIHDGGIFRDVYISSEPLVRIQDYTVITELDANYKNATLSISADVQNLSASDMSGWSIQVKALEESGANILGDVSIPVSAVASNDTETFEIDIPVDSPKLWTAEIPNLYALVLTLVDGENNAVENLSAQLGFRELEFTRTAVDSSYAVTTTKWDTVKINGQPLFLKGVNRHDTDPIYGKYVPQDVYLEDVKLMKENNINAVRTSHYSNDEYFYWLCNKYGLYMMGETNMECHLIITQNEPIGLFYELGMDRTKTAFERLKNHPAIVIWSIGNEMAYTTDPTFGNGLFRDMIWFFKNNDPTRLVHSEGQNASMGTDMGSNMYPAVSTVQGKVGSGKIPYIICEYAHAQGNSVGNLGEYWEAIRSGDNMLGGFIWDWVDQARAKSFDSMTVEYVFNERTGVSGTIAGDASQWITDAGEGSLNGGKSFSGATLYDDSKYNKALSGTGKSFSFEVIVKPYSTKTNSIFIAKGDRQVAMKTKSSGIEFFAYSGSGWNSASCSFPSDWANNWHQIVGVYDKGTVSLWIDGVQLATKTYSDAIASNNYSLGVGKDAQTGRTLDGEISIARIYTKALTEAEIKAQYSVNPAIESTDESVLLWVDYSDGPTALGGDYWDYYSEEYAHNNLYADEMKGQFMAYGGDWGDYPNKGSICANGIVNADRTPQPELYEVKYQYQDFWFTANNRQLLNGEISVYNESSFTNLNAYDVIWEVVKNGTVVESGVAENVDVAPRTAGTIFIPYTTPEGVEPGSEYYLNISVRTKDAGDLILADHEQAYEQMVIPFAVEQVAKSVDNSGVAITETTDGYIVEGNNFSFVVRKSDGVLENYVYGGETLIKEGFKPNFWRGLVENDKEQFDFNWQDVEKTINVQSISTSQNYEGLNVITVNITFPDAGDTKETIIYTVNGTGEITVDMSVDATQSGMGNFLRVGSMATLPAGFENVTWYGNGPVETFSDRKTGARQGIWSTTVSEMFYPYVKVDDSTFTDVVWMKIANENLDNALVVVAQDYVEASALHFTPDDLNAADHPYELAPREETILSVNYGSLGTGGATCGFAPLAKYRLPSDTVYNWKFTFMPVAVDASSDEVNTAVAGYHTVKSYKTYDILDASKNGLTTPLPETAQYVNGEYDGTTALKGYFTVNDIQHTLLDSMTNGKPFTVASRVYIPSDIFSTSTGVWEGTSKHNLIFSLGDKTFGFRIGTNTTRTTWALTAYVCDGSKWYNANISTLDKSLTDMWHDVAATYSGTTLTVYLDGQAIAETTAATSSITQSGYDLCIGYDPSKATRKSELTFDSVVVYNEALTAEQLSVSNKASDDNVILWMDFEKEIKPDDGDDEIIIDGAVYVASGATGTGESASNPMGSISQAFALLEDGGDIVVVGDFNLPAVNFPEVNGDVRISGGSITLLGDIAFAKNTNSNVITFDLPVTSNSGAAIYGGFNSIVFGENFDVAGTVDFYGGVKAKSGTDGEHDANYALNATMVTDLPYSITVNNGIFGTFVGGNYRGVDTDLFGSVTAPLTVTVNGGTFNTAFNLSGMSFLADDATLTVNGGTFNCPVYAQGTLGAPRAYASYCSRLVMTDKKYFAVDGDIDIALNGGTFNGGIVSAHETLPSYTQCLRGNFTLTIGENAVFAVNTLLDATQVKAYEGETAIATLTCPDENAFNVKRFDKVNGEARAYEEPLRISFIGDSITEGTGSTDRVTKSYPYRFFELCEAAGKEVVVGNYGVGGSTILSYGTGYYNKTVAYSLAYNEADSDYVLIAIGTNDAALAGGTIGQMENFTDKYEEFVRSFGDLSDTDKVFTTSATYRFTSSKASDVRAVSVIRPTQKYVTEKLAAEEEAKYYHVDLYALLYDAAVTDELFAGDKLHPDDDGYVIYSEAIYDAIFNDVHSADNFGMSDIYLSASGTLAGKGTADDPMSSLTTAFGKLAQNGTLHIVGEFTYPAKIVTPRFMEKLTIVGEGSGAKLYINGNAVSLLSDTKLDNFCLDTTAASTNLICNWNNIEFTEVFTTNKIYRLTLGYELYNNDISQTTYDSVETASTDKDVTAIVNGGTFKRFVGGNVRTGANSPFGTYSGNMTLTIGKGATVLGDGYNGVGGQNYLVGTVTAYIDSWPSGTLCRDYPRIGAQNEVNAFNESNNTGITTMYFGEGVDVTSIITGDFDGDDKVTLADALQLLKLTLEHNDGTEIHEFYSFTEIKLVNVLRAFKKLV